MRNSNPAKETGQDIGPHPEGARTRLDDTTTPVLACMECHQPVAACPCGYTEHWEKVVVGLLLSGIGTVYPYARELEPVHIKNPALRNIVSGLATVRDAEKDAEPRDIINALDRAGVYGAGKMELPAAAFAMLMGHARDAFYNSGIPGCRSQSPQQDEALIEFTREATGRVMVAHANRSSRFDFAEDVYLLCHNGDRPAEEIEAVMFQGSDEFKEWASSFKRPVRIRLIEAYLDTLRREGLIGPAPTTEGGNKTDGTD